jgi:hypothetical protein
VVVHAKPNPKLSAPADTSVEVDDEDISEQYGPVWPEKAYGYHANGRVVLACRIDALGFAQSCTVAAENPQNMGFAAAALQVQPGLRLPPPPGLVGAQTVVKTIAIKFTAPDDTLDGSAASSGIANSGGGSTSNGRQSFATAGSGASARTGNPIIMKSITMMEHPIWVAAPGFEDMRRAYPAGPAVEGYVVLRCEVERAGELSRCAATKELPENRGFEKAALSLAHLFRVAPDVMVRAPRNGKPIQVVVPIRFAPPEGVAEPIVSAPAWISGVDPDTAPKLFPPEAVARGLTTGRGVARCVVGDDGALTGCSPERADPDGIGFSEAAVVLAATMKMNLWSADAGPVRGGVVRVPIRLNLAPSR